VILEIPREELADMIGRQLASFLVFRTGERALLDGALGDALARIERCFAPIRNRYYHRDGEVYFSPFQTSQNTVFLYFLSRAAAVRSPETTLADRLYYLNKILNGVDLYHQVELPDIFLVDHALGAVMGRARYGDFFAFAQGCTVGNNRGKYPTIGKNVILYPDSAVVGDSVIGDNCAIAARAFVKDEIIPPNTTVFGTSPHLVLKPRPPEQVAEGNGIWDFGGAAPEPVDS
jgi:serine O-acetyltransferase